MPAKRPPHVIRFAFTWHRLLKTNKNSLSTMEYQSHSKEKMELVRDENKKAV
jgi:hypothetical protein